jgi:hypothetical protein
MTGKNYNSSFSKDIMKSSAILRKQRPVNNSQSDSLIENTETSIESTNPFSSNRAAEELPVSMSEVNVIEASARVTGGHRIARKTLKIEKKNEIVQKVDVHTMISNSTNGNNFISANANMGNIDSALDDGNDASVSIKEQEKEDEESASVHSLISSGMNVSGNQANKPIATESAVAATPRVERKQRKIEVKGEKR